MSNIVSLASRRKKAKYGGPKGGGGGTRPPDDEIRQVLSQVTKTLVEANDCMDHMQKEIEILEHIVKLHGKYILTITQALLNAGVDIPLTSKPPDKG